MHPPTLAPPPRAVHPRLKTALRLGGRESLARVAAFAFLCFPIGLIASNLFDGTQPLFGDGSAADTVAALVAMAAFTALVLGAGRLVAGVVRRMGRSTQLIELAGRGRVVRGRVVAWHAPGDPGRVALHPPHARVIEYADEAGHTRRWSDIARTPAMLHPGPIEQPVDLVHLPGDPEAVVVLDSQLDLSIGDDGQWTTPTAYLLVALLFTDLVALVMAGLVVVGVVRSLSG